MFLNKDSNWINEQNSSNQVIPLFKTFENILSYVQIIKRGIEGSARPGFQMHLWAALPAPSYTL